MPYMRLDKFICDMGLAARSEAKRMIRDGRVFVDGRAALGPEERVDPELCRIAVDGRVVSFARYRYYMLDKPAGVLTAARDKKQPTVLDLMPEEARRRGVFPVGRLDKDTTGLLLLTDDGDFAHRVISPRHSIEKLYEARVDGIPNEEDVEAFRTGIVLADGTQCLPAKLELTGGDICRVTVFEGKYHQVKRMLASRGKRVLTLRRLRIGGLWLDESLGAGAVRELSPEELCIVSGGEIH